MITAVPIPGKRGVFSYNSDKHEIVEAVYQALIKTPHKASKDEIWIAINEYEDLMRVFLLVKGTDYRWYIPYVGYIHLKKSKQRKGEHYVDHTKSFNEEFLKIK